MASPASTMPWMAESIARCFIRMKSVSVLSRSKKTALITRRSRLPGLLGGGPDHAAQADLTVIDTNIEAAVGIGAHPGFVGDRCALAAIIRERNQHTRTALHAFRKSELLHEASLPSLRSVRSHILALPAAGDILPLTAPTLTKRWRKVNRCGRYHLSSIAAPRSRPSRHCGVRSS